jgi:metallo-beta-lactamase family protein
MRISFLGAAREVTGSCYLLEAGGHRILVDCGMFQGGREARRKNREALAFDPRSIDCVLLTHAHIDHSGLLPRLVALGYRGPIHATTATCDLLAVMLPDAAYIQEKEVERETRHRHRARHAPEQGRARSVPESAPLYTVAQAHDCLHHLRPVDYDTEFEPLPGMRCRLRDAGHILGAAIVELWIKERGVTRKLVFSGDIGQPGRPVVRDPTPIAEADVLLVESTYGNRLHKSIEETERELVHAIDETIGGGGGRGHNRGNLVVPSFAVGRTQEILYVLGDLMRRGRIARNIEIIVDSPMATRATEITMRHLDLTDIEMRALTAWQSAGRGNRPHIRFTESVEDSVRLNELRGAIIISASGMCDAGRVKHHLRHNLPRAESGVLITGFQAEGTLGRRLVDGARRVKIFGEEVAVRARLYTIGGLSAHADQAGLLGWLSGFRTPPQRTFVVHGESATAEDFARLVHGRLGWRTEAPLPLSSHSL